MNQPYEEYEWFYADFHLVDAFQQWFKDEWHRNTLTDSTFPGFRAQLLSFFPKITPMNDREVEYSFALPLFVDNPQ